MSQLLTLLQSNFQKFEDAANAFYDGVQLQPENMELVTAFRYIDHSQTPRFLNVAKIQLVIVLPERKTTICVCLLAKFMSLIVVAGKLLKLEENFMPHSNQKIDEDAPAQHVMDLLRQRAKSCSVTKGKDETWFAYVTLELLRLAVKIMEDWRSSNDSEMTI